MLLTSCAIGPLVSHETARTVGNSKHEVLGGYGHAGYIIKWNYGLSDNLDLGLHWESFSIGLKAKYSFINAQESGLSLAAALGTGASIGGSHYYGDLMMSYLSKKWEPYSTLRFVRVKSDEMEFNDEETGERVFTIDSSRYSYGQFFLGTRYWLNQHWLLSLEASSIFTLSSVEVSNNLIISGGLGYRF